MVGRFICLGGKVFGFEINLRVGLFFENYLVYDKLFVKFFVLIEEK